jgi:anti-anti-sigma factor
LPSYLKCSTCGLTVLRPLVDTRIATCPRCGAVAAPAKSMPEATDHRVLDAPATFRCELEPDRARVNVRPVGDLDLATTGELDQRLRALRAVGFDHLVVDLAAVTFLDSAGVHLLVRWATLARSEGWVLEVLPGRARVERVLDLTGVRRQILGGAQHAPGA